MKKKFIVLFVLTFLSVSYSRQIQIPVSSENSPTTIELYNIKGQKILTKEFLRYDAAPVSLSNNLANQIYIMRIKNGNRVFTRKFMPDAKIRFVGNFANTNNKIPTNEITHNFGNQYQNLLRSETLGDSVTKIIFINGMLNTRPKAEISLNFIRAAYTDKLKTEEYPGDYVFELGYNQTHSRIHDLAEVMFQWKIEFGEPINALEWLAPIIDEEYYEEAMEFSAEAKKNSNSNKRKGPFRRIAEAMIRLKSEKASVMESHSETTDELRKIIDKSFEGKQRVIIISHSQGNLFANELIDYYKQNGKKEELLRTEVLNIAPPTVSPSKLWWYTNNDDAIINDARESFNPKILSGSENFVISGDNPRERRRHDFWKSYFHDNLRSRQLIDSVFFEYCTDLPFWLPIYHPDDVAQINNLIKNNDINWLEYDNPESWSENYVSWTDTTAHKRITRLRIDGIFGDVSLNLPALDSLYSINGEISSLDITKCIELTYLNVSFNQLTELDLSKNTKLIFLFGRSNRLTELNLLNNRAITTVNLMSNRLTYLNLSNNRNLTSLWVNSNRLTSLDLSNNTELTNLSVDNNLLTELDLSNNTKLKNPSCLGNLTDNLCQ